MLWKGEGPLNNNLEGDWMNRVSVTFKVDHDAPPGNC